MAESGTPESAAARAGHAEGAEKSYDVLVVGGGPAGAMAAYHAAAGGLRVGIVDRNERVGVPVRCGEAVGVTALAEQTAIDPAWVLAPLRGTTMVSPSGIEVLIDRMAEGYVVRRDIMDAQLVQRAVERGAAYHPRVTIVSASPAAGGHECAGARGERFRATCLVLADGVESRLARQLGWATALAAEDISSCAFAHVSHPRVPVDRMEMHYGSTVAPRGYAWVFPRGQGAANVGVGVLGTHGAPGRALECLHAFVKRRFGGDAQLAGIHCGGVPVGRWSKRLVREGAMLVGDAARQVDPLTGGGITHAMHAGTLAGKAAVQAFQGGTFRPERLRQYERSWAAGPGKALLRTYALKRMVIGLDDATLDRIARRITARRRSSLGLAGICVAAFGRRPLLLLKALMVYW